MKLQIPSSLDIIPVSLSPKDTGAGIMLLESYTNSEQDLTKPTLILFGRNNHYEEGGGKREYEENHRKTATRELTEESLNTFRIDPNLLHETNAIKRRNTYVCYFLHITTPNGIQVQFYKNNSSLLTKNRPPHGWTKTHSMTRVCLDRLVEDGVKTPVDDPLYTLDVYGNSITLDRRTKGCVRQGWSILQKLTNTPPIILNENLNFCKKNSPQFLKGTQCYWANAE